MKIHSIKCFLSILFSLLTANLLSAQEVDYYLKIVGPNIAGSSVTTDHENEIVVLSYALSASNDAQINPAAPEGIQTQTARTDGVEFLIQGDVIAIPKLFTKANDGSFITTMTLTAVASVGAGNTYNPVIITLTDCAIGSISQEGSTGDLPIFSVLVVPSTVEIKTRALLANGSEGAEFVSAWDYTANVAPE